jgi:Rrf2 family transcriptional regulator, nitric oxide-sensitive transcriptional repressor
MNKINRKIEYALMALKYMSQKIPGELTTAKEVSENFRTPFDATARVMQIMAQKGWLRSEQGAFGGYQITKDLSKVSMHDLIEIIEGRTAVVRCLHNSKDNSCEIQTTCNIASPISKLNFKLNEFYQGLNLKELLVNHG